MALTQKTHELICDHFVNYPELKKQSAIDATCGNGYDTLFLCEQGFGKIYALDIQEQARQQTKLKTKDYDNVCIIPHGHETMSQHINDSADVIMFNLGYLPNSDKSITTLTQTTIEALEQSTNLLNANGLLTVICYPGHETGKQESASVSSWFEAKSNTYPIEKYLSNISAYNAPILHTLKKSNMTL